MDLNKRVFLSMIEGKNTITIDYSDTKSLAEFDEIMGMAKELMTAQKKRSLYSISILRNVAVDSDVINHFITFIKSVEPYTIKGAVIGLDAVTKIIFKKIIKNSERANLINLNSKNEAIDFIRDITDNIGANEHALNGEKE